MEGSCHCGAVRFEVAAPPATVTECNCSICRRLGVLWAYYTTAQVRFLSGEESTVPYLWGDRSIAFHHCPTCGCTTHYRGAGESPLDRVAVNARLLPLAAAAPVAVRRFDGAGSFEPVAGFTGAWPWRA